MKQILCLALAMAITFAAQSQITLGGTYTAQISLVKLQQSGFKYLVTNPQTANIKLYNTNHSLWKTITIPAQTAPIQNILYVSETLFDTDSQVEYAINTNSVDMSSPTAAGSYTAKVLIYKENGTLVFSIDSAMAGSSSNDNIFASYDGVFDDGTGAKLKVWKYGAPGIPVPDFFRYEIYNLPGIIPCNACGTPSSNTTYVPKNNNPSASSALFYPNPASNQVKINYELPGDYKKAFIRIQDAQGKLIESFEVSSDFKDLIIPADYQNGLYLYTLEVDGKVIKTDKIILAK